MKGDMQMNRILVVVPRAVLGILLLAAMWIPATAGAGDQIHRLAADPKFFGEFEEASTIVEPPGLAIYDKTVFVPGDANVLYLTMSTTGDTHDGAASCFTALVDGNFFNPGGQGAARCAANGTMNVPGWVALIKEPDGGTNCNDGGGGGGDCHDNATQYQWCTPISRGTHSVQVRMATNSAGKTVFIEQAFFYVDASRIKSGSACGVPVKDKDDDRDDDKDKDKDHGK
jgi:hypothetical protein